MTYRDDLEAAQARAAAAERRAAELEGRLAREVDGTPIVAIPERFQVTSTVYELTIRWRRQLPNAAGPLMIGVVLTICAPFMFFMQAESAAVYGIGLAAFGVPLLYWGLLLVVNLTTVSLVGEELRVRRGPLPQYGSATVRMSDIKQLFVRKIEHEEARCTYTLFALVDGDREIAIVPDLDHSSQAQYLERAFEQRLRVRDRPVAGEASK